MTAKLTARQQEILDLIQREIARTGFPPTRAEISRSLGFRSANAAEDHLKALARKGAIELTAGASRGIRLKTAHAAAPVFPEDAANDSTPFSLPLIGRVAAGSPILATAHIEREVPVDPALFGQAPDYLLRVRGASMRDAGILDGDLLAVRRASDARDGQIIVARMGDDVTVKRLVRSAHGITLMPENPDFSPMHITEADHFALEGIAVGLIRTGGLQ